MNSLQPQASCRQNRSLHLQFITLYLLSNEQTFKTMSHIEAIVNFEPDAKRKNCYDCTHCKAAVSWWCVSEEARKARGTGIPGEVNCKFWEPCRQYKDLSWWERNLSGNFILISEPPKNILKSWRTSKLRDWPVSKQGVVKKGPTRRIFLSTFPQSYQQWP